MRVRLYPALIGFWSFWFCEMMKTGEPGWNLSEELERGENQQQTRPINGTGLQSNPGHTAGGERSQYCAMPAPHNQETITRSV